MSLISLKKRHSHTSSIRSRVITQTILQEESKQNLNIDQSINENLSSVKDTISMLKDYQRLCIEQENFLLAEQTKNKIAFLQSQQKTIAKEQGILRQQQTIQMACKQGEEEVQNFQAYWDETVKNLIQQLKEIESNFINQQQTDLNEYRQRVSTAQGPKIKYSSKILELRKNLTCLIKMRKYKEADETKNKLRVLESECEETWGVKNEDRVKILVEKFQRKQVSQLKALKTKMEGVLNQKIKERDQKFQILLKRNRKRQIESSKPKVTRIKESSYSRSRSQSRVVLGNSKISVVNTLNKF